MAKKMMKKTLAMVLAVSLLASQLALPAIAMDSGESQTTQQITVTNSSSSTTVDPVTGAETTVNTVEGTTPDGASVKQETTITETHTEQPNNPMVYQDKTEWTEETTVTQPDGTKEKTAAIGSELVEGDVIGNPDGSQTYTRDGGGSETTTVDSSKTEQVSQNETVLDPDFETGDTGYNDTDLNHPADVDTDTNWKEGELTTDTNKWQQGGVSEGQWVDGSTSSDSGEIVIADPNLNSGAADDVSLENLTPGGAEVKETVPVTLANLAAGLYPEVFKLNAGETAVPVMENGKVVGYSVTVKNGNSTTVREIREINGGFEVTTKTTTDPGKDSTKDDEAFKNEEITYSGPTYTNKNGENGEKSSVKIDEFETKLNQGTKTGTEAEGNRTSVVSSTGADDSVTTTTVKEVTDADGNKGYNETKTIVYKNVVTTQQDVPLTDAKDPSSIPASSDKVTVDHRYDAPAQANDVLALAVNNRDNGDGTFTTITVKEVLESNGSSSIHDVTGYEVVETKTDKDGKVISTETKTHDNVVPPMVLDRDNGDGTFTNVTLTEIKATQDTPFYKAGDTIGWSALSVLTDEDGNVLETKTREVFGTEVTLTTTVTTDPLDMTKTTTYERTDTYITNAFAAHYEREASFTATQKRTYVINELEEITKYLQADNNPENLTFIYKGQMLGVKVMNGHGTENVFDPSSVDMGLYDHDDGIQGYDYRDYNDGGFHNYSGMYSNTNLDTDDWTYNGKGLLSIFQIQAGNNATDSNMQEGKMFRVVKDGEERFVYCIEFTQNVQTGKPYTYDVYGDVTEDGTKTFKSAAVDAYLCSTALNGFWGNTDGVGSLDAVKDFLRRMGEEEAAENLTAGEAVTATQAVMWHFTANGDSTKDFVSGKFVTFINNIDGDAIRSDGDYRTQENINEVTNDPRVQRIYKLYNALVSAALSDQADGKTGAAQAIEKENIIAGQIDVKESMGNNQYKTDLHVKLDVSRSSINDDLIMTVKTADGDRVFRLSGTLQEGETYVTMDTDGNVILPDVVLTNNTDVKVELTGRQSLDKGVRIYKSSASQDFIGLSTKLHNVALEFGYRLGLIDPKLDYETETTERSKTNTVTYTTNAKRTDTRDTLKVTHDAYKTDRTSYVSQLNGLVTETLRTDMRTMENVRWDFYYEYLLTVIDDEDGGGGDEEIFEEEVPLAAAPKTGDASLVFAAISALSMAGATIVGRKKEEE